jgi:Fe-S-cluster containining protein
VKRKKLPVFYSCRKCPAYCCSYAEIDCKPSDVRRLAKHFEIPEKKARKRFTKKSTLGSGRVLRHQHDEIFQSVCRFLDTDTRQCTVYKARPAACRAFPGSVRCGYYDFLADERSRQEDPELMVAAWPV